VKEIFGNSEEKSGEFELKGIQNIFSEDM